MKQDIVDTMKKIAAKKKAKVVVCEGWDERCIEATSEILKEGLVHVILLGKESEIKKKAKELKVNVDKAEFLDFKNSEVKNELAEKLAELRKHKGMTLEDAKKLIDDENYFGCMYAYAGYADAVGGSAIGSTAELMRPALQILRKKDSLVSEVIILDDVKNNRVLFGSDFSLNVEPTPEQLAQIAINAAGCVREFKIEPVVALLSFSTKGSGGDNPQTQLIRKALDIAKKQDPILKIDGEMQVDAAVSEFAAGRKCPNSEVGGKANTLVFPNLDAGNIFAHGILQFSDMSFIFSIIKGMAKPVGIFGRSVSNDVIENIILSLAMQVNSKEE